MIEASFDRSSRQAAVSGVYQYDTGQRLRLSGLPSPDEMSEADDFLSGDLAAVQVHFGYEGDEQTAMRLAQWDDDRWCWMTDIPDEYLTRIEPVHVFVYVSHGSDENQSRGKTMYEGVFTPISRPAPSNVVSEDQLARWAALEAEVDLVLVSLNAAEQNALGEVEETNAAAKAASDAANSAQSAADRASDATARLDSVGAVWGGMTVRTTALSAGSAATATLSGRTLTLGVPNGAKGQAGDAGDVGPADIALSMNDGVLTITRK